MSKMNLLAECPEVCFAIEDRNGNLWQMSRGNRTIKRAERLKRKREDKQRRELERDQMKKRIALYTRQVEENHQIEFVDRSEIL